MKHFAISDKKLEFKNLLSGPAPIGRLLNYIYIAGSDKLFHRNGYRSMKFEDNIGSAWATEFMIGLELVYLGSECANKTALVLSPKGERIFELVRDNYSPFIEETNGNAIVQVRQQINAYIRGCIVNYIKFL